MTASVFRSIILGAPASGKGTISSRIIKTFNFEHISSGDLLRLHIKNSTELGLKAKDYIVQGKLVPDELMIKFICNTLNATKTNWLLDGFPRTLPQAQALWLEQKVDAVLNLDVPFETIIARVQGRWIHLPSGRVYNTDFNAPKVPGKDDLTGEDLVQREDDRPEIVQKRLDQYDTLTRPVIDFYANKKILHTFFGRTSDEIWPKVYNCLIKYVPLKK